MGSEGGKCVDGCARVCCFPADAVDRCIWKKRHGDGEPYELLGKRRCGLTCSTARWVYGLVILAVLAVLAYFVYVFLAADDSRPVHVTGLQSATGVASKRLQSAPAVYANPSAFESAFATLDELTLDVAAVRAASLAGAGASPGGGNDLASTEWGAYKRLTLRPSSTTIPIDDHIKRMGNGPYFASDFVFWNNYIIKAYCRTANAFLYTTATGVVALNATPTTMPTDYAGLQYSYMNNYTYAADNGDHAVNTLSQAHQTFINSQYYYEVTSSSTVTLYVDTSFTVSCYDGSVASRSAFVATRGTTAEMVQPMGQDISWGGLNVTFNWSAPIFGFSQWQLPVFVHVTDNALSQPHPDTYVIGLNQSAVASAAAQNGTALDWSLFAIATATWDAPNGTANATLLDFRVRGKNGGATSAFAVWGGFFGMTANGTSTWAMYNGNQRTMDYRMWRVRVVTGFKRYPASGDQLTVVDGPDCTPNPSVVTGSTAAGCSNATTLYYYARMS